MLQAHLSSKVATLVEEVFRRAGCGVLKNTSFTVETVLVFVYKLLNNTVAQQTRYVTASQPDHIGHTHESACAAISVWELCSGLLTSWQWPVTIFSHPQTQTRSSGV